MIEEWLLRRLSETIDEDTSVRSRHVFMEGGEMHLRLSGPQAQMSPDNSLTMKPGRSRQQAQPEAALSALYGMRARRHGVTSRHARSTSIEDRRTDRGP